MGTRNNGIADKTTNQPDLIQFPLNMKGAGLGKSESNSDLAIFEQTRDLISKSKVYAESTRAYQM